MVDALSIRSNTTEAAEIPIDSEVLELAARALTYFTKPNGRLPQIGDTVDFKVNDIFNSDAKPSKYIYEQFKYAITQGKRGEKPNNIDLILESSGYAILRDKWYEHDNFLNGTHLVLKSGFLSNYHRQDDDTSFVLYAYGEDWLIDSGLYKYEEKDPYRIYMRSSDAHNLSVPYGIKASRSSLKVSSKLKILEKTDDKVSVKSKTSMFRGFSLNRIIEHNKNSNTFLLSDSIKPLLPNAIKLINKKIENKVATFATRFHVPKDKTVKIEGSVINIIGKSKQLSITVKSDEDYRVIQHIGKTEPRIMGWSSDKTGVLDKARVIELRYFKNKLDVSYDLKFKEAKKRET